MNLDVAKTLIPLNKETCVKHKKCVVTPTCKLSRMMRSDWTCLLTALEKRSYVAASYSLISISFNLRQKVRQKQRGGGDAWY